VEANPHFSFQGQTLLLNEGQAMMLKEKMKKIKSKKTRVKVVTRNIDILKIENLTSGIFPSKKCFVAKCRITIDPYGNVIPCSFLNNYAFGNVRSQGFKQIWNNDRHRHFVRNIVNKIPACEHCIISVERNSTFSQLLKKSFFAFTGTGLDE